MITLDGFSALRARPDLLKELFVEVPRSPKFKVPNIRDSWLKGLRSLVSHRDGLRWLLTSDVLPQVVKCTTDSSRFVALSACRLLASSLVLSHSLTSTDSPVAMATHPPVTMATHPPVTMAMQHKTSPNPPVTMATQHLASPNPPVTMATQCLASTSPPVTMATQHLASTDPPVTMATEHPAIPNMAENADLASSTATIFSYLYDQLNSLDPGCTAAGLKVIAEVWRLTSGQQLTSDPMRSWSPLTSDLTRKWFPLLRSNSREVRTSAREVLQAVLDQRSDTADLVPDWETLLSLPAVLADPREAGQVIAVLCVSPPLPRGFPEDYYDRLLQQTLQPLHRVLQTSQAQKSSRAVVSAVCCSLSALETFISKVGPGV
ncbi:uncharacterized protein [Branchiostoma lanceolatum]|uniref:uncharacterized protein n=1 Tax=Branchiostoma lanceolatum TaxID=7740 RepID=UPI00345525EE